MRQKRRFLIGSTQTWVNTTNWISCLLYAREVSTGSKKKFFLAKTAVFRCVFLVIINHTRFFSQLIYFNLNKTRFTKLQRPVLQLKMLQQQLKCHCLLNKLYKYSLLDFYWLCLRNISFFTSRFKSEALDTCSCLQWRGANEQF